jgi:hypothetical protein
MLRFTILRSFATLVFCLFYIMCRCQDKPKVIDRYIDEQGHEIEIIAGWVEEKQPTDNSSWKPEYKGGPFFEAFKFIQSITNAINNFHLNADNNGVYKDYDRPGTESYFAAEKSNHFLSFGIGLGVANKGSRFKFSAGTTKTDIWYLEVPQVKLRYGINLVNASTVFFDLNPYYAIAIGGNTKSFTGTKTSLKFGTGAGSNFKRSDWGFKLAASYRLKNKPFFVGLLYDLGLGNISPTKAIKTHNRGFGLQVGCQI